jgi:YHS domain-containing protein
MLINALFISEFPFVKFNSQPLRLFQVIRYLLPVNDSPCGQCHQTIKGDFVKTFKALFLSISMILCVIAAAALSNNLSAAPQGQSDQPKGQGLVQVEAKYVCMINNQRFNKEQIPVAVGNRTYYGCCQMCKDKLRNDPRSRAAIDPVSKKKVDKATAIIGVDAEGSAYYFENAENLKQFKPSPKASGNK